MTPRLANTTAFLGAFLLFLLQPVIAKHLLPRFGGASTIWTAAVFFFMTALLIGYLYAYALLRQNLATRTMGQRGRLQTKVHTILLCAASSLIILEGVLWGSPLSPPVLFESGFASPIAAILLTLLLSVGIPSMTLAATSPLLEEWLSRARGARADFRLYAFSNAGSLCALLAYPLILEQTVSSRFVGLLWGVLFLLYALFMARAARASATALPVFSSEDSAPVLLPLKRRIVALWLLLPALGSLLLLAATAEITRDLAPVPFLWLLPLALYLLSFIVAFAGAYSREIFAPLALLASIAALWALGAGADALGFRAALFGGSLFFILLVCHGEVYLCRDEKRPALFYLALALGGAFGGLLANLAPLFLNDFWELPFALFLSAVLSLELLCVSFAPFLPSFRRRLLLGGVFMSMVMVLSPILARIGNPDAILRARNFYGTLLVRRAASSEGALTLLRNGAITHGSELSGHPERPTTYYGRESGVGIALRAAQKENESISVGVLGLGAGSMAAYCRPSDSFVFYEINPAMERIARERFSFLAHCKGAEVILGDGRLRLQSETRFFNILAMDAFSGDAIPLHLLTREAIAVYLNRLPKDGILALHLSNRYIDLKPVALAHAKREGLFIRFVDDKPNEPLLYSSEWALMSRAKLPKFETAEEAGGGTGIAKDVLWSDEKSSIFPLLRW